MKQVQKTIGRWVQRLAAKSRTETTAQPERQPFEVDPKTLRQISGGSGTSTLPTKGW